MKLVTAALAPPSGIRIIIIIITETVQSAIGQISSFKEQDASRTKQSMQLLFYPQQ